jgi:periplasmic protein TonB
MTFAKKYYGFDEVVFENRNQEYGAYILRKTYNKSVIISLFISLIIVSSIIIIPFIIWKTKTHYVGNFRGNRYTQVQIEHFELPRNEILLPKINPPPKPALPDLKYVAPAIVDTVIILDKMQITDADKKDVKLSNDTLKVNAMNKENDLIFGEDENGIAGDYAILETQPSFKGGGKDKFREWVSKNTNYPKNAQDSGIYGKVIVTFVIEMDGSVSNVKIIKGVAQIIDDEAIKTIKASPKWSPGLTSGRPVRVRCSIPLIFLPRR